MEQVDKEKAFQAVMAMVGKFWGALKTMVQGIGVEVVAKAKELYPVVQELQLREEKRIKHRRQVTYRKKKCQAKRKAWKKYRL